MVAPSRADDRTPPSWLLPVLVPILVALVVGAYVGDAAGASWQRSHPVWLILLNTRVRWLVLVSPRLDAGTYYGVAFFRLVLSDPLFYVLGLFYGDRALRWLEHRAGDAAKAVTVWERFFKKASYPMVALVPNNIICLLAGAAEMPIWAFALLNGVGTLGRLALVRVLGETFQGPLDDVSRFLHRYQWWLIALSVAVIAVQVVQQRRRGTGELEELVHLREDLEAEDGA